MKINLINCSEKKETKICYNYKKIGYISPNCRQKKFVKTKKKTEKESLKKLKTIPKRELITITEKTNKQICETPELFSKKKKRFKQIAKLFKNLKYYN